MNMKKLASVFANRPRAVIAIFTIIAIMVGSQALNVYMVSDFSSYLPSDDPTLELWREINKEFRLGSTIIIFINQTDRYHYNIRDYEVLHEMDKIYYVLYEKPRMEGRDNGIDSIKSLSVLIRDENAKPGPIDLGGGNGKDEIPREQKDIYRYIERIEISSMKGVLYTEDFKYAVIIIQLDKGANYEEVLLEVQNAVDKEGNDETDMTITGTIAMQRAVQKESMNNLIFIFPVAILFVAIVLFYFHRSIKGVIIAFLPPAFALLLTFGVLGIVAPELTLISVAIIALLLGLGVDYSIHLMNRLTEERTIEDKISRVEKILRSTGKAVLLSTITTMIGFGSLMISSMTPMVLFGFGCAIGILFCFISAVILVPCLVISLNFDKAGSIPSWKKFANFTVKYRKRIIIIAGFFAVMSLLLIPQIQTDVNYFDMAPENIPEIDALVEYSEKFGGGGNFNAFVVRTDPGGLEEREVIQAIYDMERKMETKGVKLVSIADTLKEISDILSTNIIIEKLANLTDADNIIFDRIAEEGIVDKEHSTTLIQVSIPVGITIQETEKIINELNQIADETNIPRNGRVSHLAGQDAVNVAVNNRLFDEQSRSMVIAIILVLGALILIFSSSIYGALTMIPIVFVLMWEPGFFVALNIPLSLVTITIASITIGIGIDYGVHITHRVREELNRGLPKLEATKIAIEKTGLSLVEAALTTVAGMASMFAVSIPILHDFVMISICMTSLSCIGAALILPAIYNSKIVKLKK